jgi:hypothetical protein
MIRRNYAKSFDGFKSRILSKISPTPADKQNNRVPLASEAKRATDRMNATIVQLLSFLREEFDDTKMEQ